MFGLKKQHIEAINGCFNRYPAIEEVLVYGSRAKGNYRRGSDIDLTIIGDLEYSELLRLENQLDDLLLPYKIDLSLKHTIDNPELLAHINRVGKTFYQNEYQLLLREPGVTYTTKKQEVKEEESVTEKNRRNAHSTKKEGNKNSHKKRGN